LKRAAAELRTTISALVLSIMVSAEAAPSLAAEGLSIRKLPVRGLHLSAPGRKEIPAAVQFIREELPKEKINTLILEFDYSYDFKSCASAISPHRQPLVHSENSDNLRHCK
jgi:hypothetical protein